MAYLHEGLSEGETKIVEQLFNSGAIQVIYSLVQEISVTREKLMRMEVSCFLRCLVLVSSCKNQFFVTVCVTGGGRVTQSCLGDWHECSSGDHHGHTVLRRKDPHVSRTTLCSAILFACFAISQGKSQAKKCSRVVMKTKDFCEYFFVSENFETCNFFCSPTEGILIELKPLESIGNLNGWSDSRDKNLARVSMKASYQRSSADCKTSCCCKTCEPVFGFRLTA